MSLYTCQTSRVQRHQERDEPVVEIIEVDEKIKVPVIVLMTVEVSVAVTVASVLVIVVPMVIDTIIGAKAQIQHREFSKRKSTGDH